ncbi:MAG: relaxase/mobilization nuclease domain-containing protein, partial [Alphaproteobacteria bacterium]|nr:relaxase/mobilization nuclease domain-containing protein [Alphaproteobacteria bacterium]
MAMILDGNTHGDGATLARYMQTGKEGEIATVVQFRGPEFYNGNDPVEAFALMQGMAEAATKSTMPFFHGYIQCAPGERLTEEQLIETADRMEKRMGFNGHPRFITTHTDIETGQQNYHVAWFRMDAERECIINPGLYPFRLMDEARKLEEKFGLRVLDNERQPGDRARPGSHAEYDESHRLGTNLKEIRNGILDCLEHADSGKAFKAALEERNLMLANGDRRDCFVVIDEAGGHHALNKKLTGMTLAETRERLSDLARTQLPGVEQAQDIQRARTAEREQRRQAIGRTDEIIRPHSAEIELTAEQAMQAAHAAAQGRKDEVRPHRYAEVDLAAEQAMQEARRAAQGRTDNIRPDLGEAARDPQEVIRMYRGIGNNVDIGAARRDGDAVFFSTDPTRAAAFGKLHYVDITADELAKFEQPHSKRILQAEPVAANDWRTADPDIIARLKPLELEREGAQPDYAAAKGRTDDIRADRAAAAAQEQEKHGQATAEQGQDNTRASGPENGRESTVQPDYASAKGRTDEVHAPEIRPLGKTAGEIRLAWQLTATPDQFAQALEDKGLILVHISHEEAEASHRAHAFAKAVDRQSRELREGFAVVDQRGNVTRIDQRVTGDHLEEIQKRLGGIDKSELVSVADAKEIMAEANRAAWVEKQRIAQEQERAPSWIENRIAETADRARIAGADAYIDSEGKLASKAEVLADRFRPADEQQIHAVRVYGGTAFETRLDEAGIAIARVTDADIKALTALRHGEDMARIAADTNNEAHKQHHFAADLVAGDIAAITSDGSIYKINPDKTGDAKQHLTGDLPSIVEARAYLEQEREQISALWQERRADAAVARADFAAEREANHAASETARAVSQFNQSVEQATDTGERAASGILRGLAGAAENIIGFMGDMFFAGPPPT